MAPKRTRPRSTSKPRAPTPRAPGKGGPRGCGVLPGILRPWRGPSPERVRQGHADARRARDAEIRAMTPGERMELAYRLSKMQRGL